MNPYAAYLEGRDPLVLLLDTPPRIRAIVSGLPAEALSRSYAPGKWDVHRIMLHLAQTEVAFGMRARMALTDDRYVAQPFDQDVWMGREGAAADARVALDAYLAVRALNLRLFRTLGPADLDRTFSHPERGTVSVRWILELLAGHEIHHRRQLEQIAAGQAA